MSASVHTTSQTGTMTENSIEITEGREMSASVIQGKNKIQQVYREILKIEKEIEMTISTEITNVRARISEALAINTPAKILGGLALGALLMASMALPLGTVHADDPASPLVAAAISTIDYTGEFEDLEGVVGAKSTATTVNYTGEFEDVEGVVGAKSTANTVDHTGEFEDVEGVVGSKSTANTVDHTGEFEDVEGLVGSRSTSAAIDYTGEFEDVEGVVGSRSTPSAIDHRDEFGNL